MKYISTRGNCPKVSFTEALMAGLAPDGGLYLPETYPLLPPQEIANLAGKHYSDVAHRLITEFIGEEISSKLLLSIIDEAYSPFRHKAVAPLVQLEEGFFVLELFHGPTLAFKDFAMQLLARLIDHVLKDRGSRATIIGATSGDTGAAAIEAFKGLAQVDLFILYPHGRVSEVQRRQMTAVDADNIHVIALDGTFDDCQKIVKSLFNNLTFRNETKLSGVNSINFARILAQIVYYFTAALSLGAPFRPISFTVPTGNFGDIFAGWMAKKIGLPVQRLVIATNSNDILVRSLREGIYEPRGVYVTQSPSMDIQISSNFERLLFELGDCNSEFLGRQMDGLAQSGRFELSPNQLSRFRQQFAGCMANETETTLEIGRVWKETGVLIDPHTAVGVYAARQNRTLEEAPMIVLGTAHPAKFPEAIRAATGQHPVLPAHLSGLLERPEKMTFLPNDEYQVAQFIGNRSRASKQANLNRETSF